jgi:hypothetical protein
MTKRHFIALADSIRYSHVVFTDEHLKVLADFCKSQNGQFNRAQWFGYIKGDNGPNGGNLKPRARR